MVQIPFNGGQATVFLDQLHDTPERKPCIVVGLSSHYHDKFSDAFRRQCQLILADFYWTDEKFTQEDAFRLTFEQMVVDIETVRSNLAERFGERFNQVIVLGHSAYGFLAVEYARMFKQRVSRVVSVCCPLNFDGVELEKFQEQYLALNFGQEVSGGPTERYRDYFELKEKNRRLDPSSLSPKQRFVGWYVSMGPILWKEPPYWKDEGGIASQLWSPWEIPLIPAQAGEGPLVRDVNISMLSRYFELVQALDMRQMLSTLEVPTLCFVGLYDARVSMDLFDPLLSFKLDPMIELYYIDTGHWPMFEAGRDEFDQKVLTWMGEDLAGGASYERSSQFSRP